MTLAVPLAFVGTAGLAHLLVSALVHGLIYSLIFRLVAHLTLSELVVVAALVIGALFLWARNNDRRRW